MGKEIYYDKSDIKLEEHTATSETQFWFQNITEHEVAGLELMGSKIVRYPNGLISTFHDNDTFFFNRTIGINNQNIGAALTEHRPRELVIPSFITKGKDIEDGLLTDEWLHSLSSIVLVSKLDKKIEVPDIPFKITPIDSKETFESGFEIFSSFFLKSGELVDEAYLRFTHNVNQGPHRIILDGNKPIAMIGSIVIGELATIYSGIIDSEYRNTQVLDSMRSEMSNTLLDQGIVNIYMKTRNKAVNLYTQRFFAFKNIYNERIYEKR